MAKFDLCITGDLGFEFWKDIPGYEGRYQASTYGNIKSVGFYYYCGWRNEDKRFVPEKVLIPSFNKKGYLQIRLSDGKKRCGGLVHSFIAKTFIPKFNKEFNQVNHKDEIKTNNRVENLEWCDNDYNIHYGTGIERAAKKLKGRKLSEETKQKIRESKLGEKNPMFGKKKSDKWYEVMIGKEPWNKGKHYKIVK